MKKIKPIIPFLFPIIIIILGLIIYNVFDYEPSVYTVVINMGLAYILSPRLKKIKKQHGIEEQFTWLFYKKIIK